MVPALDIPCAHASTEKRYTFANLPADTGERPRARTREIARARTVAAVPGIERLCKTKPLIFGENPSSAAAKADAVHNTRISVRKVHRKQGPKLPKFIGKAPPLPRYVQACKKGAWSIALVDKLTGAVKVCPYKCGSWRCGGECGRRYGKILFARLKTAFDRAPDYWSFLLNTCNPQRFRSEKAAWKKIGRCWAKLRRRLKRAYGNFEFIALVEQHQNGWPHIHIAVRSRQLYVDLMPGNKTKFKRWFTRQARQCGLGWCFAEHAKDLGAINGYLIKCAALPPPTLPGELAKDNQLPVNAPRNFRRFKTSVRFLPRKIKNEKVTGTLIFERAEKICAQAMQECLAQKVESLARGRFPGVDLKTGELASDLLGDELDQVSAAGRRRSAPALAAIRGR